MANLTYSIHVSWSGSYSIPCNILVLLIENLDAKIEVQCCIASALSAVMYLWYSWSLATKCWIVAEIPVDWSPLIYAAAIKPFSWGSSENDSKPRPPNGERWVLTVGPRRIWLPNNCALESRLLNDWKIVDTIYISHGIHHREPHQSYGRDPRRTRNLSRSPPGSSSKERH